MTITEERPRTSYLGGGDMAAICGKSEWRTPMDVWLEKTGKVQPKGISERMQFGILLEPVIVAEWARRNAHIAEPGGFCQDQEEPWRAGHADAIAYLAGAKPGRSRLLEAKAVGAGRLADWQKAIPIDYQYQGQHYLALYGAALCTFPVLFGGQKLLDFHLEADPIVQHEIQSCARDFWHSYVLPDKPPPGSSVEHAGPLFGTREATKTEREILGRIAVLRSSRDRVEDELELLLENLRENASGVTVTINGVIAAQWKHTESKAYTVPAKSYDAMSLARYPTLAKLLNIELPPKEGE